MTKLILLIALCLMLTCLTKNDIVTQEYTGHTIQLFTQDTKRDVQGDSDFFLSQVDTLFGEEYKKLKSFGLDPSKKTNILDIGCGPGHFGRRLLDQSDNFVLTCMDIDQDFVTYNQKKILGTKYEQRMKVLQGSIFDTKLPADQFDFVIARFVYQHIHNIQTFPDPITKATHELKRVLKTGGKLVATDSDHSYTDMIHPVCEKCNKVIEKQFTYRVELAKSPTSHDHSGTELYDYLKVGGLSRVRHEAIFVSSKHFPDGITKFLPMLTPEGAKQLVDLKLISPKLMQNAMQEYHDNFVAKIHGEPFMNILVFVACGEKSQDSNNRDEL